MESDRAAKSPAQASAYQYAGFLGDRGRSVRKQLAAFERLEVRRGPQLVLLASTDEANSLDHLQDDLAKVMGTRAGKHLVRGSRLRERTTFPMVVTNSFLSKISRQLAELQRIDIDDRIVRPQLISLSNLRIRPGHR
ncbi:MAG: hypothetical protein ACLPKB_00520 [Xanthobacteraceae bacterium]